MGWTRADADKKAELERQNGTSNPVSLEEQQRIDQAKIKDETGKTSDEDWLDPTAGKRAFDARWQANLQDKAAVLSQAAQAKMRELDPNALRNNREIGNTNINRDDLQFRQGQMALMQQLQEAAAGRGPSIAAQQLKQGMDRNNAQALGMAATMGGNPALAARNAALGAAQANQATNRDAAMARLQEQLSARDQLGGVLNSARGQDMTIAANQAQLDQQAALANQGAYNQQNQLIADILRGNQGAYNQGELANTGYRQETALANQASQFNQNQVNEQNRRYYEQLANSIDARERDARIEHEKWRTNIALGLQQQEIDQRRYDSEHSDRQLGAAAGVVMGLLPLLKTTPAPTPSDENLKKDIKPAHKDIQEFLKHNSIKKYKYKNEKHGKGEFVSPMAQDLEKSKLGKSMVIQTPEGKMVDYGRGFGTMLSTMSLLNERIDSVEAFLKKSKGKK